MKSDSLALDNPFVLMLDTQVVLGMVARSEALGSLNSRVHRPLEEAGERGRAAPAPDSVRGAAADLTDPA